MPAAVSQPQHSHRAGTAWGKGTEMMTQFWVSLPLLTRQQGTAKATELCPCSAAEEECQSLQGQRLKTEHSTHEKCFRGVKDIFYHISTFFLSDHVTWNMIYQSQAWGLVMALRAVELCRECRHPVAILSGLALCHPAASLNKALRCWLLDNCYYYWLIFYYKMVII